MLDKKIPWPREIGPNFFCSQTKIDIPVDTQNKS